MICEADRTTLHEIARQSVAYGLQYSHEMPLTVTDYSPTLQQVRASFVTLTIQNELRGCIGTLEAYRPLAEDVTHNAYAAAFHDPRFPRLSAQEFDVLQYHISVLETPEAMRFDNEQDLLMQLKPGVDGLILEDGHHRGTFLPQVWESLPEPRQFLQHLKQKAGLPSNYWSQTIKVQRYRVEDF